MTRLRALLLATALLSVAGCSSLPLATLWQMRDFGLEDLATVEPAQVRIANRILPRGMQFDPKNSRLTLELTPRDGGNVEQYAFGLRRARVFDASLLPTSGNEWQVFELDATSAAAMLDLRPRLAAMKRDYRKFEFSFRGNMLGDMPPATDELIVDVRLQLAARQKPLVLLDGARMAVEHSD